LLIKAGVDDAMGQPEEVREAMTASARTISMEKLLHALSSIGQADIKGDSSPLELEIAVLRAVTMPKPQAVAAAPSQPVSSSAAPAYSGAPSQAPSQPPQSAPAAADTPQRGRRELSESETRWRNVWDSLRRTKFRRWVLGPILSNVVSPEPADNKITLRFKSMSVRKRFMEEMEDPRAKEAVRSAIDREYGPGLTLVLASPQDEEAAAKSATPASAESPLVRAAMAMGARVVEEEPIDRAGG
jgi:hypothetical protein